MSMLLRLDNQQFRALLCHAVGLGCGSLAVRLAQDQPSLNVAVSKLPNLIGT